MLVAYCYLDANYLASEIIYCLVGTTFVLKLCNFWNFAKQVFYSIIMDSMNVNVMWPTIQRWQHMMFYSWLFLWQHYQCQSIHMLAELIIAIYKMGMCYDLDHVTAAYSFRHYLGAISESEDVELLSIEHHVYSSQNYGNYNLNFAVIHKSSLVASG